MIVEFRFLVVLEEEFDEDDEVFNENEMVEYERMVEL